MQSDLLYICILNDLSAGLVPGQTDKSFGSGQLSQTPVNMKSTKNIYALQMTDVLTTFCVVDTLDKNWTTLTDLFN